MNIAFYSGVSGMIAFQNDLDVLAHNMANVNTVGYKPQRSSFEDLIYREMYINKEPGELVGHGVRDARVDLIFSGGNLQTTGYMLDYAIAGDGFFALERKGQREYTRNGAFNISIEGKNGYLVSDDGAYVLDSSGARIQLKRTSDGDFDIESIGDQLGIYQFDNPSGLQWTNGSSYTETVYSGAAKPVNRAGNNKDTQDFQLRSGMLEASTVDMAQTMVDVIMAQRSFQFNSRVVQTADEVEEIVNTLRN